MTELKRMPFVFVDKGDVWVQEGTHVPSRRRIRDFNGEGPHIVYEHSLRVVKAKGSGSTVFTIEKEGAFMYKSNPGVLYGKFEDSCKQLQVASVVVEIKHVDGKEPEQDGIGEGYKISYTEVPKEEVKHTVVIVKRQHGGQFSDLILSLDGAGCINESTLFALYKQGVEFTLGSVRIQIRKMSEKSFELSGNFRSAKVEYLFATFDLVAVSGEDVFQLPDGSRHKAVRITTVFSDSSGGPALNAAALANNRIEPVPSQPAE